MHIHTNNKHYFLSFFAGHTYSLILPASGGHDQRLRAIHCSLRMKPEFHSSGKPLLCTVQSRDSPADCHQVVVENRATMSTLSSTQAVQRLAELVRQRAGLAHTAKAKAANRLTSKYLQFVKHLFPNDAQKEEAAQWFRQSVENVSTTDFHRAMIYAYNSYAGGGRTQEGNRTKRIRSSEVRTLTPRGFILNCAGGQSRGEPAS